MARNTILRDNVGAATNPFITADYGRGSSGIPVVDHFGNLVGTVSATRSIYYNQQEQQICRWL